MRTHRDEFRLNQLIEADSHLRNAFSHMRHKRQAPFREPSSQAIFPVRYLIASIQDESPFRSRTFKQKLCLPLMVIHTLEPDRMIALVAISTLNRASDLTVSSGA